MIGTGGYGGGTVDSLDKTSWSGHKGYYAGKDTWVALHWNYPERGEIDWISKPGRWEKSNEIYTANGYKLYWGAPGGEILNVYHKEYPHQDLGGGGGGYYGGEASCHNNGGGAGGSAYADIEGKIKQVTDIKGYSGYENGNGAEMKGKYGNGKLIISK